MFALSRKKTDRGKTILRRKTLQRGGNSYECMVPHRMLQTRRRAQAANTLGHAHRHRIDGPPCQDVAATKDMQPAQAKPAKRSIGAGTCESCKLLKFETTIVRPGSVANVGGPTAWLTSRPDSVANIVRPDSVANIGGPIAWPTSRPEEAQSNGQHPARTWRLRRRASRQERHVRIIASNFCFKMTSLAT